jgi:DNA polymerase-3 subunit gamma/tau
VDAILAARNQIKGDLAKSVEKKNSNHLAQAAPSPNTPPISAKPKTKSTDMQQRLAAIANNAPSQAVQNPPQTAKNAPPPTVNDEDYRWTWLNPELENQAEATKPSEIKQAILQDRTPELVAKTISLACEQDEWSRIVNNLKLGGISRQLALNSHLAEKNGQQLSLVLKANMAHLDNEESRKSLADALAEQHFTYDLCTSESSQFNTPLEIRRQIYEKLTEEARIALQQDPKLALLRKAFDAEIDESTIRAVAENA